MAFSIDGIIIDRIQMGIAEDFSGNILYTLTQLADASIEVSTESKEARDATGTLIKKFYTGKSGTFTANNAMIDFNILAASTGTPKQVADESNQITMPGVLTIPVGTKTTELKGVVEGSVRVIGIAANGTKVADYAKDVTANETKFSIAGETLSLPTANNVANFVVKYDRKVSSGVKVANKADEFPRTIKLTLKALAVDACTPDTVRSVYIVLPSFQVSPDTNLSLTTDAQLTYNGVTLLN